MADEYNCDSCGVSYKNEDSVSKCVECEATWCAVCSEDVFCPYCAAQNAIEEPDLAMLHADPEQHVKDCPDCNNMVATWKHTEVFDTGYGTTDRVTAVVCMTCGYCHETKTEKIKE